MLMIQSTISAPIQKTAQIGKHGCYLALHGGFGSPSASFHFPRISIKRNSVQGTEEVHGGFGFGARNGGGTSLLDFARASELLIANSTFRKREEHLVTFKSSAARTQIDYILIRRSDRGLCKDCKLQIFARKVESFSLLVPEKEDESSEKLLNGGDITTSKGQVLSLSAFSCGSIFWLTSGQVASASESVRVNMVYEVGELFELGIQLTYLLILLALLGAGSFFVIRQVLVRRELDLSAKELQEQVRSGDASATELFELGAVMLRRKFYPAATKYLLQAVQKWDGDDQDLAQVYNALGVSYVLDEKIDKGIAQFENAVKLQPGYVTAWNNLGDAYEKTKDLTSALRAFEEVLLFDPNNKIARPRRDALKEKVQMYKGVPVKSKKS